MRYDEENGWMDDGQADKRTNRQTVRTVEYVTQYNSGHELDNIRRETGANRLISMGERGGGREKSRINSGYNARYRCITMPPSWHDSREIASRNATPRRDRARVGEREF